MASGGGERDSCRELVAGEIPVPEVGTLIEGKYRVDRVIGRGGMGVVVAATHVDLDEPVAIKFLQVPPGDTDDDFHARFTLEARVCAKLRNEHIARVHDAGEWLGKSPFMVMELLEGVDLRRILRADGRLGLARAVDLVVQICEGLAEAHAQGIVHRDLKPPNIFVTKRKDGTELVKVLDFGISKWAEELGELTKTGVMLGSPKYMSPEQLNGSAVDGRADIWSIGAMLYAMLTGRPPYDFANVAQTFMAIATGAPPPAPTSLDPTLSPAVEAVILKCLNHDRDQRVANVAELAGELLRAVESPLAAQVQARIAAMLEPATVSVRSGPLSSTTGSYAAFALGTTGSFKPTAPLASTLPAPAPRELARGWLFAGSAGAALLLVGLVGFGAGRAAGANAASVSAKEPAAKHLALERATRLAARPLEVAPPRIQAAYAPRLRVSPSTPAATPPPAPIAASEPAAVVGVPAPSPAPAVNPLEERQ